MPASRTRSLRARLDPMRLHPTQQLVLAFASIIAVGTLLLTMPVCSTTDTSVVQAAFTATSATTVTGLTVVDTSTHWTVTGQVILLVLFQIGGLGIMTFASAIGIVVARRLGLRSRLLAETENRAMAGGDLRSVLAGVLRVSLLIEVTVMLLLTVRWLTLGEPLGAALWRGLFHAVSAFNNAGFALYSDSLAAFASDPFILVPVMAAVMLGSFGFPVLFELWRAFEWGPLLRGRRVAQRAGRSRRRSRPARGRLLSLNAKLVLSASVILLGVGWAGYVVMEWNNPGTLGAMDWPARVMNGLFQSTMTRSGGLSTFDQVAMHPETWLFTEALMFIGGGPAGTGGGIKVTTFAVLVLVVLTEVRGDDDVTAFGRQIPRETQRQVIAVLWIATLVVVGSTMALMTVTDFDLDHALFEIVSAFATVGLSTGGTADLPPAGMWVLIVLMFAGRVGPVTVASALALRRQRRLYDYPKERPLIG